MPNWKSGVVQIGDWMVNPALDTISRGSETHKLEPRATRLLLCLADSAGDVVSVDALTEVWSGVIVGSASVYQAVSQLRKLLGDTDPDPTYIATVPRKGYRLIAPVRRVEPVIGTPPPAARRAARAAAAGGSPAPPAADHPRQRGSHCSHPDGLAHLAEGADIGRSAGSAASIVVLPFVDLTAEKADQSFATASPRNSRAGSRRFPPCASWRARPRLHSADRMKTCARSARRSTPTMFSKARCAAPAITCGQGAAGRSRDGFHMWSANFDRPTDDAIKIQEDISRSVAKNCRYASQRTPSASSRRDARRILKPMNCICSLGTMPSSSPPNRPTVPLISSGRC